MILELSYFSRLLQAAKEMLFENASNELLTFSPMKIEWITLEKFDSHQHTEIEQPRSLVKTTCRYIKKKKRKEGNKEEEQKATEHYHHKTFIKTASGKVNIDTVPAHWEFNIQDVPWGKAQEKNRKKLFKNELMQRKDMWRKHKCRNLQKAGF